MDLKDFVAESLRQIIDGVKEAQEHAGRTGAVVVPLFAQDASAPSSSIILVGGGRGTVGRHWYYTIEYDIGLVASENVQTKLGAGLLTVVSAGGSRESTASQETTSRVKFSVPIVLPHQTGKPPAPSAPPRPA